MIVRDEGSAIGIESIQRPCRDCRMQGRIHRMTDFVHLRLHTEYSIVDGLVRVKPLMERVAALGMPAVGLTDVCNFYALIQLSRAAFAAGLQPIVGVDLLLPDADHPALARPRCLLANILGLRN